MYIFEACDESANEDRHNASRKCLVMPSDPHAQCDAIQFDLILQKLFNTQEAVIVNELEGLA